MEKGDCGEKPPPPEADATSPKREGEKPSPAPSSAKIQLIVGLGNPGKRYAGTRHNVGFMVVELLAKQLGLKWKKVKIWQSELAKGDQILLVKPLTFMNDSGTAIARICKHHKVTPEQILLLSDAVAHPLGQIRIRKKGSAGGHNCIRDTIRALQTEAFPRFRLGIDGRDLSGEDLSDFVLGKFTPQERLVLEKAVPHASDAVTYIFDHGLEAAMNQFNGTGPPPAEDHQAAL